MTVPYFPRGFQTNAVLYRIVAFNVACNSIRKEEGECPFNLRNELLTTSTFTMFVPGMKMWK